MKGNKIVIIIISVVAAAIIAGLIIFIVMNGERQRQIRQQEAIVANAQKEIDKIHETQSALNSFRQYLY